MRDDFSDRLLSVTLLLLGSALAGYAFAFGMRKGFRARRALEARRRFKVVRGSFGDDALRQGPSHLFPDARGEGFRGDD